jgi:hypothetical protein
MAGSSETGKDQLAAAAPVSVDLLWEEGQRRLASQSDQITRLDSKTTPLLAFGLAGVAFFQSNVARLGPGPTKLGTVVVVIGILATLAAIHPRRFQYTPQFDDLLKLGNRRANEVKTAYLGNIRTALRWNESELTWKTWLFRGAIWSYVIALAVALGAILASNG